jgi:hypothetical protein
MSNVQDVQGTIDKIRNGQCTEDELLDYLDSTLVLIKANTIIEIIKLQLTDKRILGKLYANSNDRSKLLGVWTNGHLAIAALKLLNTSESQELFQKSFRQLDEYNQRDVENLIQQIPQIM